MSMQFFRWHEDLADKHHMCDLVQCSVYHMVIISQLNFCYIFFFFFCENVSAVGAPKVLAQEISLLKCLPACVFHPTA